MRNAGGALMGPHKDLLSVECLVKLQPLDRCLSACWIGTAQIQVRCRADGGLEIGSILDLVLLDPGNLLLNPFYMCVCMHMSVSCTSRREKLVAILLSSGPRWGPKSMWWPWIKSFHDRTLPFDLVVFTKPFLCQGTFYLVLRRNLYNFQLPISLKYYARQVSQHHLRASLYILLHPLLHPWPSGHIIMSAMSSMALSKLGLFLYFITKNSSLR